MTTLAPVDIEGAFVTYLNAELTPPVMTRIPNPRPATHVRVQVVGGDVPALVFEQPRLLVECWAATSTAAAALARQAWAEIQATRGTFVGDAFVLATNLGRPVNFPDPDSTSPRYQFTADLRVAMTEETT
jgi:hypothetical protein